MRESQHRISRMCERIALRISGDFSQWISPAGIKIQYLQENDAERGRYWNLRSRQSPVSNYKDRVSPSHSASPPPFLGPGFCLWRYRSIISLGWLTNVAIKEEIQGLPHRAHERRGSSCTEFVYNRRNECLGVGWGCATLCGISESVDEII